MDDDKSRFEDLERKFAVFHAAFDTYSRVARGIEGDRTTIGFRAESLEGKIKDLRGTLICDSTYLALSQEIAKLTRALAQAGGRARASRGRAREFVSYATLALGVGMIFANIRFAYSVEEWYEQELERNVRELRRRSTRRDYAPLTQQPHVQSHYPRREPEEMFAYERRYPEETPTISSRGKTPRMKSQEQEFYLVEILTRSVSPSHHRQSTVRIPVKDRGLFDALEKQRRLYSYRRGTSRTGERK